MSCVEPPINDGNGVSAELRSDFECPRMDGFRRSAARLSGYRFGVNAALAAKRERRLAGFTLIEVLMAAVAGALILGSIYTVFTRAVKMRNDATARTQEVRLRTRAVNVIRNDLQNAWVSGRALAASLTASQQGQASQFPGYLRFTTTTARSADAELHGDVQEVEYYIAADSQTAERNSGVLMRVIHNNLLGAIEEAGDEEQLLTGVESMEVSFFDGENWTDTWELNSQDIQVPKGIRVRIQPHAEAAKHVPAMPIEILVPWTTEPSLTTTSGSPTPGSPTNPSTPPPGTGTPQPTVP